MKNKVFAVIYALAFGATIFNAYFDYKQGNYEAVIAWLSASGMAAGALGATVELIGKEDEDNIS